MRSASPVIAFVGVVTLFGMRDAAAGGSEEAGFKSFFNGKDLTGWNMAADKKDPTKAGASLAGKTGSDGNRFRVDGGLMVVDPKVKGNQVIVSVAKFGPKNCHIKFEFNPGPKCNNDIYILGLKFDFKPTDVVGYKEGEWNAFEIVVKDGKITLLCNGQTQKITAKGNPKTAAEATPLSLRAEAGPIAYKGFRYKQ